MLQNNSKNIFWINAVKAICILAVYFVHCQLYYGYWLQGVNVFIHPIYVNGFFFISGYLLFRKQLSEPLNGQSLSAYALGGGKKLLSNIVFKIAIPSIIFSTFEYLPKKLLRGEAITMHTFLSNTIGGGTYWFTSALVVAEISVLFMLLSRNRSMLTYSVGGILIAALGWYLIHIDFHIFGFGRDPWAYRRGFLAVAFLVAGGLYWRYEEVISHTINNVVLFAMLLAYLFLFGCYSKHFPVLISTMDITWIGYIAALLGCVLLIELCKRMHEIKALAFVGQFSLCYYFLSGALPMIVSMVAKRILPADNFCGLICIFLVCVTIATLVTYILNRYLPWLFDLKKIRIKK